MRPNDHRGSTILPTPVKDDAPNHCFAVLALSLTRLSYASGVVDDLEAKLFGMGQQISDTGCVPPASVSFSSQLHDLNAGLRTLGERLAHIRNELVGA